MATVHVPDVVAAGLPQISQGVIVRDVTRIASGWGGAELAGAAGTV